MNQEPFKSDSGRRPPTMLLVSLSHWVAFTSPVLWKEWKVLFVAQKIEKWAATWLGWLRQRQTAGRSVQTEHYQPHYSRSKPREKQSGVFGSREILPMFWYLSTWRPRTWTSADQWVVVASLQRSHVRETVVLWLIKVSASQPRKIVTCHIVFGIYFIHSRNDGRRRCKMSPPVCIWWIMDVCALIKLSGLGAQIPNPWKYRDP